MKKIRMCGWTLSFEDILTFDQSQCFANHANIEL